MDGANPVVLNGHTPEDHFKAGVLLVRVYVPRNAYKNLTQVIHF
jgi:hypothetical protein